MFLVGFSLQDILMDETRLYLVFEFLNMDLKKYLDSLESGKYLDPKKVKSYLYQVSAMFSHYHILSINSFTIYYYKLDTSIYLL